MAFSRASRVRVSLAKREWCSLEWYGQVGSDLGRDIWGVRDDGTRAATLSASGALIASS
jgi:hypothetical protein